MFWSGFWFNLCCLVLILNFEKCTVPKHTDVNLWFPKIIDTVKNIGSLKAWIHYNLTLLKYIVSRFFKSSQPQGHR